MQENSMLKVIEVLRAEARSYERLSERCVVSLGFVEQRDWDQRKALKDARDNALANSDAIRKAMSLLWDLAEEDS